MAALILPFVPSVGDYDFETSIEDVSYVFDVRWNEYDDAWYFSIYESTGEPIAEGLKVTTGSYIGRGRTHVLFQRGVFAAIDTENYPPVDPGFDDMGTRVELRYYSKADLVAEAYSI